MDRRIRAAKFPAVKSLDAFDFISLPTLNKMLVLELARSEYVIRRENIMRDACLRHDALGNSGTGKTHVALALGLAACQRGFSVYFTSAATLVNRLMEARVTRNACFQHDGRKGKREYIQVLRLMELFAQPVVAAAVTDAIKLGAISFVLAQPSFAWMRSSR